jgi:hypothetical protein
MDRVRFARGRARSMQLVNAFASRGRSNLSRPTEGAAVRVRTRQRPPTRDRGNQRDDAEALRWRLRKCARRQLAALRFRRRVRVGHVEMGAVARTREASGPRTGPTDMRGDRTVAHSPPPPRCGPSTAYPVVAGAFAGAARRCAGAGAAHVRGAAEVAGPVSPPHARCRWRRSASIL